MKSGDSFPFYINVPFEQIKESLRELFVKDSASYFICFRHGNDLKILNKKDNRMDARIRLPWGWGYLATRKTTFKVSLDTLAYCDNAIKSGWMNGVFKGLLGSSPASTRKIMSFQSLILGSTFHFKYILYIFQRGRLEIPY